MHPPLRDFEGACKDGLVHFVPVDEPVARYLARGGLRDRYEMFCRTVVGTADADQGTTTRCALCITTRNRLRPRLRCWGDPVPLMHALSARVSLQAASLCSRGLE